MINGFRHEMKYLCSYNQMEYLKTLMAALLPPDNHLIGNSYHIESLYFDTENDRFLSESLDGVPQRKKYRLRRYNFETEKMKFELKSSFFNLKSKKFKWLNRKEALNLLSNDIEGPLGDSSLLEEFYCLKKIEKVVPKIVIDYDRMAFVDQSLDVRITFDKNITSSPLIASFFCNDAIPRRFLLEEKTGILEIKFSSIFPTYIKKILNQVDLMQISFSKYARCRIMNDSLR